LTTLERSFPNGHPAAQGHFPGNPIIPGALLLGEVLSALEGDLGRPLNSCEIASAKFLHPVRPGDRMSIEFSDTSKRKARFSCSVDAKVVLAGEVRFDIE
jgi:3-hydroxyacyl-[acyl-carrier-protein] dehydratase